MVTLHNTQSYAIVEETYMPNERKISKHGNSLMVSIPDFIVKDQDLSKGDSMEIEWIDRRDGTTPFIKMIPKKRPQNNIID